MIQKRPQGAGDHAPVKAIKARSSVNGMNRASGREMLKTSTISPATALIYVMVTMSAVDRSMSDRELGKIGRIVQHLPAFDDFDPERLVYVAEECGAILQERDGLDAIFGLVKEALPDHLRETAYAMAVEIAIVDQTFNPEEARLLQLFRETLRIDKLIAAAIERGARARHMPV